MTQEESSFDFECKDPNCPHCSYNENEPFVTDEEIEKAAELFLNTHGGSENRPITWGHMAFLAGCKFIREEYERI